MHEHTAEEERTEEPAQVPARVGAVRWVPIDPDLAPDDPSEPSLTHRRATARVHRRHPGVLASIGLGGVIGAWARYEVGLAWPAGPGGFPWAYLMINTSGAFALGLLLTVIMGRLSSRRYLRPFFCVGILGSWTTMSALAVQADGLLRTGHLAVAGAYVGATLVAGLLAASAGMALGGRAGPR
jgi:CrcB protein